MITKDKIIILIFALAVSIAEMLILKSVNFIFIWCIFIGWLVAQWYKKIQGGPMFFSPDCLPIHAKEKFSVDVITIDQDGMLNIACYDFELNEWTFHTDSLYDPNKSKIKWVWCYPDFSTKNINVKEALRNEIKKDLSPD